MGRRIEIRVGFNHKTGVGKQRTVVFPARLADQHLGVGVEFFEEICPQL